METEKIPGLPRFFFSVSILACFGKSRPLRMRKSGSSFQAQPGLRRRRQGHVVVSDLRAGGAGGWPPAPLKILSLPTLADCRGTRFGLQESPKCSLISFPLGRRSRTFIAPGLAATGFFELGSLALYERCGFWKLKRFQVCHASAILEPDSGD